jgi:hypothetical protein
MTDPKPTRPTLVSDNTETQLDVGGPISDEANPFPPENPQPSATRVVNAMRASHLSRDIKEAIISGAARYGSDGKGTGGMPGYLEMCAATYQKEYMGLLARLVPLQQRSQDQGNASINIGSVNIHPVASDRYLTSAEMRDMLTPTIEHVATETPATPAQPATPAADMTEAQPEQPPPDDDTPPEAA